MLVSREGGTGASNRPALVRIREEILDAEDAVRNHRAPSQKLRRVDALLAYKQGYLRGLGIAEAMVGNVPESEIKWP